MTASKLIPVFCRPIFRENSRVVHVSLIYGAKRWCPYFCVRTKKNGWARKRKRRLPVPHEEELFQRFSIRAAAFGARADSPRINSNSERSSRTYLAEVSGSGGKILRNVWMRKFSSASSARPLRYRSKSNLYNVRHVHRCRHRTRYRNSTMFLLLSILWSSRQGHKMSNCVWSRDAENRELMSGETKVRQMMTHETRRCPLIRVRIHVTFVYSSKL